MLEKVGLIRATRPMGATSQLLTQGITGQATMMVQDITVATQAVGIMEVISAEVTLVGGITKVRWENGGDRTSGGLILTFETSCAADVALCITTANGGQKISVANGKTKHQSEL